MLANRPDFIGTVPMFDFQNLQTSGRPDFLEFQLLFKARLVLILD